MQQLGKFRFREPRRQVEARRARGRSGSSTRPNRRARDPRSTYPPRDIQVLNPRDWRKLSRLCPPSEAYLLTQEAGTHADPDSWQDATRWMPITLVWFFHWEFFFAANECKSTQIVEISSPASTLLGLLTLICVYSRINPLWGPYQLNGIGNREYPY